MACEVAPGNGLLSGGETLCAHLGNAPKPVPAPGPKGATEGWEMGEGSWLLGLLLSKGRFELQLS